MSRGESRGKKGKLLKAIWMSDVSQYFDELEQVATEIYSYLTFYIWSLQYDTGSATESSEARDVPVAAAELHDTLVMRRTDPSVTTLTIRFSDCRAQPHELWVAVLVTGCN